jgi:gamma-polyglutamate biosynthesis protein CapC
VGFEAAFVGLLFSLACIAITGIYPGGIIVPSYLSLFLDDPARLAGTIVIALLTFVAYRVSAHWLILFGRRRLVFLLLTGGSLAMAWLHLVPSVFPASLEYRVIGWVIPGLIAHHLDRQGVAVTLAALATVTVAAAWAGRLLLLL